MEGKKTPGRPAAGLGDEGLQNGLFATEEESQKVEQTGTCLLGKKKCVW